MILCSNPNTRASSSASVHRGNPSSVRIRPFPFPFSSGFAICSDIDLCNRRSFVEIHRFLNTEKGLGLPVADSFFGVSSDADQLALFSNWEGKESPDFQFILEALQCGLMDSLHTWADCNRTAPDPYLLASAAKRTVDALRSKGLQVPVWINHGADSNLHNLKARLKRQWQGDDPAAPLYSAHLLSDMGTRFYWWSEIVQWPLSQNRPGRLDVLARKSVNGIKNFVKRARLQSWKTIPFPALNHLAVRTPLRSGQAIYGFSRYNYHPKGPWTLPTRETLRYSISEGFLRDLIRTQGWAILYTHLGLPVRSGSGFLPEDARALEILAQHYHDGLVWVAPTAELLKYWELSKTLVWSTDCQGDQLRITIKGKTGLDGALMPVTEHELQGLAFTCATSEKTSVAVNGKPAQTTSNKKDREGLASITIGRIEEPEVGLLS